MELAFLFRFEKKRRHHLLGFQADLTLFQSGYPPLRISRWEMEERGIAAPRREISLLRLVTLAQNAAGRNLYIVSKPSKPSRNPRFEAPSRRGGRGGLCVRPWLEAWRARPRKTIEGASVMGGIGELERQMSQRKNRRARFRKGRGCASSNSGGRC